MDRPQSDIDISELPANTHLYLAVWDCNGLEFLYNVSAWDKARVWSEISGQPTTVRPPPSFQHLVLRARYNQQRHYEIYTFTVDSTISEQDLRDHFDSNPQSIVDLIRDRGNCLYSDRTVAKPAIV